MSIQRFVDAQQQDYKRAYAEVAAGNKQSHWMWYIFPQIHSLGYSQTSKYYAIKSTKECEKYLQDEYLRSNLVNLCNVLLDLSTSNAEEIFGGVDAVKLCSCMTLFDFVYTNNVYLQQLVGTNVFDKVLSKYFDGSRCDRTLLILQQEIAL